MIDGGSDRSNAGMRFRPSLFASIVIGFASAALSAANASSLPRPAHVVVIVDENKTLAQIEGNRSAPYINTLATHGALFTHATGVMHPSLPNYLALFSGLTNDNGDGCPATGISPDAPNLGSELLAAHLTFAGYAENLPETGSTVCAAGDYARKHAPWIAFRNVPGALSRPLSLLPAYGSLPTVAFIIPDVDDDMHDGTIDAGDDWLVKHGSALFAWAVKNDTLVILTWDEGYDSKNTIPTIFFGPMVKPGRYAQPIDHYNVLRTIESMYGLPYTGRAAKVASIENVWK